MSASVLAEVAPGAARGAGEGYRLRPFAERDYVTVHDAIQASGWPALVNDPEEMGRLYARYERAAFTALYEGRVLGCAGIVVSWQGFGVAWMVLTPEARQRHGFDLFWMLRARFRALIKELGLRRLEADVLAGWEQGERMMRLLGFHVESEMPRYGPRGETFRKHVLLPPNCPIINDSYGNSSTWNGHVR